MQCQHIRTDDGISTAMELAEPCHHKANTNCSQPDASVRWERALLKISSSTWKVKCTEQEHMQAPLTNKSSETPVNLLPRD